MVDILLIKSSERKNKKYNLYRPYSNKKLNQYEYSIKDIYINCLAIEDEKQFKYEDKKYLLLILGDVYENLNNNKNGKLSAIDIAKHNEYLLEPDQKLRGHFAIFKIDKNSEEVTVINDIFGLKVLYYGFLENKFIISSSLSVLTALNFSINETVLYEKIIFYHSLSEESLINRISTMPPASLLYLHKEFKSNLYFNWNEFLTNAGHKRFEIEEYIESFNLLINKRAVHDKINLVALTGGHDGRAVLSSFIKNNLLFETFSFGRVNSENTAIPESIARELGFKHTSIYLDEDFEKHYFQNGIETLWLTDGELPFEQQSTLYGAKQMSGEHSTIFTGLLAGEILGPIHLIKDYLTPEYYRNIYLKQDFDFNKSLDNLGINSIIREKPSEIILKKIKFDISERIKNNTSGFPEKLFHLTTIYDLIHFGFRKFYGSQIHLARYYLKNNPVFYDFDLLKILIQSDFHYTYKNSFKNKIHRRNSRFIQCSIIQKNNKVLAGFPLDRGYPPYWTLYPILKYFRIIPYYKRKKRLRDGTIPPDFITSVWMKNIFKEELFNSLPVSGIFNKDGIIKYLNNNKTNQNEYHFETNRIISQYLFIHYLLKK